MRTRFVTPIAWGVGLALVCARAGADGPPSPEASEARVARMRANASVWAMESAARRARAVLRRARVRGDSKEIDCASDGLSQADSALRAGREHASLVVEAWRRVDVPAARAELARVATLAEAARAASARAELCIDEPRPAEGTTVRLVIDER